MNKVDKNRWKWAYFFIAPSVILICILCIWPIMQTIGFSLNKVVGFKAPEWNNFDNYKTLFNDAEFWKTLGNTFIYTLVTVPIGVGCSLLTAILLNQGIKFKSLFRVLFFIPVISAPVAIAMVWRWLYNSDFGLINYLLSLFGIEQVNWLADPNIVLTSLIIVGIWSYIGYNMVIFLAGLQEIPKTYYEAADIDGASAIRKIWSITIPMVSPTLFFVSLTTMITSLQVFDHIYMIVDPTNPALKSAQSIVYIFYKYTFEYNNKGYGSAIASVLLFIILLLTIIQMKAQKKWVNY